MDDKEKCLCVAMGYDNTININGLYKKENTSFLNK